MFARSRSPSGTGRGSAGPTQRRFGPDPRDSAKRRALESIPDHPVQKEKRRVTIREFVLVSVLEMALVIVPVMV